MIVQPARDKQTSFLPGDPGCHRDPQTHKKGRRGLTPSGPEGFKTPVRGRIIRTKCVKKQILPYFGWALTEHTDIR